MPSSHNSNSFLSLRLINPIKPAVKVLRHKENYEIKIKKNFHILRMKIKISRLISEYDDKIISLDFKRGTFVHLSSVSIILRILV